MNSFLVLIYKFITMKKVLLIIKNAFLHLHAPCVRRWAAADLRDRIKSGMTGRWIVVCIIAAAFITNGAQAQNYVTLDLKNTNFQFNEEGAWDQTYQTDTALVIKHATFYHGAGTGFWEGFTLANNNDSTWHQADQWLDYQWGSMAGGGAQPTTQGTFTSVHGDPSIPYIVASQPFYGDWSITLDKQYEMVAILLANHPYPYYVNQEGNGFARKLDQQGDFLKLTIHGSRLGQEDYRIVEHTLAFVDEHGTLQQERQWIYVDLTSIGTVDKINFKLESTDNHPQWGMNTPAYFCIGELVLLDSQESNHNIHNQSHVFPNPFYNTLNVTGVNVRYVNVFTINGTLVKQIKGNDVNTLQLNTSNWQQGNYIIQVNDDDGAHVHKVVKK
jgi:hypothetical protein